LGEKKTFSREGAGLGELMKTGACGLENCQTGFPKKRGTTILFRGPRSPPGLSVLAFLSRTGEGLALPVFPGGGGPRPIFINGTEKLEAIAIDVGLRPKLSLRSFPPNPIQEGP